MMTKQIRNLFQYLLFISILFFCSSFSFGQAKIDTTSLKVFSEIVEHYVHTVHNEKLSKAERKLHYIQMFKKIDSLGLRNKSYSIGKLLIEFENSKLRFEREKLIYKAKKNERRLNIIIILLSTLFILMALGFIFQYVKKKGYKKSFEELMSEKPKMISHQDKAAILEKKINVPDDILRQILTSLDDFENKYEFVSSELTLNKLAKKINTNANYLSKVINHYKEQSFSSYLSNLRIGYTVHQLKENNTFRKFTIKAIAEEVGFKTSESFAKAFYKSTGIRPSYFIKELENRS
jgi:YesN/AraC family two-component response regulator